MSTDMSMARTERFAYDSRLFIFGAPNANPNAINSIIDLTSVGLEPAGTADLAEVADVIANIDTVRALLAHLLAARDERIRRCLAKGISYRALRCSTGLSRSSLDTISRGWRACESPQQRPGPE